MRRCFAHCTRSFAGAQACLRSRSIFLLLVVALTLAGVGCSNSPKKVTAEPAISVSIASTPTIPTSILTGGQLSVAAVVANDSFNAGVTWTISCSSTTAGGCGTFPTPQGQTPPTVVGATGSNIAETYFAPAALASGNSMTVTITATSVSDTTKSANVTVTINAQIAVAFNPAPPAVVLVGGQVPLTAVVSNDPNNQGVNWTLTCGSDGSITGATCGSLSAATTASGTPVTYTAPATLPAGATSLPVQITATSISDATKSVAASLIVGQISIKLNPASVPPGSSGTLTAVVANDPNVPPAAGGVTWSVTCSVSACGTFGSTTYTAISAATYSAAVQYNAPATAPPDKLVSVTVTSVTDPTKSATATVLIEVPPVADGTYVFSISGQKTGQPYFVAGALQVQGGAVVGGEEDYRQLARSVAHIAGSGNDQLSGTIVPEQDGNVQFNLVATCGANVTGCTQGSPDPSIGVNGNGVEILDAATVSKDRFLLTENDGAAVGAGTLDAQTGSVPLPSGTYVFYLQGADCSFSASVLGGVVAIDGTGTISGKGSVLDVNDFQGLAGVLPDQSLAASTVTEGDNLGFGRVLFNLALGNPLTCGSSSSPITITAITLSGYQVDQNHIRLVETDQFADAGGTALLQSGSNFSITGSNYVFSTLGGFNRQSTVISGFGPLQVAGLFTASSGGGVSGNLSYDSLGSGGQFNFTNGTYSVDDSKIPSRVTVTLTDNSDFSFKYEIYLTGDGGGDPNGDATSISMDDTTNTYDAGDALAGPIYQQSAGTFTTGSLSGPYAFNATGFENSNFAEVDEVGSVTADSTATPPSLNGAFDFDFNPIPSTAPSSGVPLCGTYNSGATNGVFTGTIQNIDVDFYGTASCQGFPPPFTYYLINLDSTTSIATKFIAIETDTNNQMTLGTFELCTTSNCSTPGSIQDRKVRTASSLKVTKK